MNKPHTINKLKEIQGEIATIAAEKLQCIFTRGKHFQHFM